MKALVKYASGDGNVDVLDVPEPPCGENQVRVEIAYCGVCGTDIHVLHDTFRNFPPVILGHEFAGKVVEVGRDVKDVKLGERIVGLGASAVTCGQCQYCLSGNFIFCANRRGMGHGVNGAFARYVSLRPDQVFRIPGDLPMEEAAMSEPFAAAIQAVTELTNVRIGDVALVSGPGPIGLLCLKLLVAEGIKTIVAGAAGDDLRLEAARRIGAADVVDVSERSLEEVVREHTDGRGFDVAFECAGHPSSVRGCLDAVRPMGRYTQVGICGREVQFPIDQIFYKQLTVQGSICYTAKTWDRMMKIFAQGKIRLDDLVSAKLPVSDWRKAFDMCLNKQGLKVLMYPE
ncbi:MAG TPA: alcohol dehydrogenase catalytic domain-containing protein [Terriglobales bacterium]|nr:alcohol dehydrogenase catalytic domain-containing protein [Terriglobales bacterium]